MLIHRRVDETPCLIHDPQIVKHRCKLCADEVEVQLGIYRKRPAKLQLHEVLWAHAYPGPRLKDRFDAFCLDLRDLRIRTRCAGKQRQQRTRTPHDRHRRAEPLHLQRHRPEMPLTDIHELPPDLMRRLIDIQQDEAMLRTLIEATSLETARIAPASAPVEASLLVLVHMSERQIIDALMRIVCEADCLRRRTVLRGAVADLPMEEDNVYIGLFEAQGLRRQLIQGAGFRKLTTRDHEMIRQPVLPPGVLEGIEILRQTLRLVQEAVGIMISF